MDWGKAKNYTIIFLILLNILLFFCNIWVNEKNVITDEQINAVKSVLDKKGIKLSAEIPKNYDAMAQVNLDEYNYDVISLQEIFFPNQDDVRRFSDSGKIIITSNSDEKSGKVTISDDIVTYEKFDESLKNGLSEGQALNICEKMANAISKIFTGLEFYDVKNYGDYYNVEYVQTYKGEYIFNNYIKFKICENGNIIVQLRYFPVKNSFGNSVDICSADEALFIFSNKVRDYFKSQSINVSKIEKGYYFTDFQKGESAVSMPFYRIEINEKETPFFINAYDRTFNEGA